MSREREIDKADVARAENARSAVGSTLGANVIERRCGTCKRWRPRKTRDAFMNGHFGRCTAPEPILASCFSRLSRYDSSSTAGDNCPKWLAGGKYGVLK